MYVFLALFFIVLWVLQRLGVEKSLSQIRYRWLVSPLADLNLYIWPSLKIGLLSSQWRDEFFYQALLWRSQIWDYRRFLFSVNQGIFSYVPLVLSLSFFMEINSYIVMLGTILIWLASLVGVVRKKMDSHFIISLVYFSLLVFFIEYGFKNSGLLMQFFLETELVFLTTIDSHLNLFILLLVSVLLGFIFPVQGWSILVTFFLYLNSQISYLGMVCVLTGECLGLLGYWFFKTQTWDNYYRKKMKGFFLWTFAYLLGYLIFQYFLSYFVRFGGTYNQLAYLKWLHLGTVITLLSGLYIVLMVWGHFSAARQEKELVVSDHGLCADCADIGPGSTVISFVLDQLKRRRGKLSEFEKELELDPLSRAKVPPFVRNQFELELKVIDAIVNSSNS